MFFLFSRVILKIKFFIFILFLLFFTCLDCYCNDNLSIKSNNKFKEKNLIAKSKNNQNDKLNIKQKNIQKTNSNKTNNIINNQKQQSVKFNDNNSKNIKKSNVNTINTKINNEVKQKPKKDKISILIDKVDDNFIKRSNQIKIKDNLNSKTKDSQDNNNNETDIIQSYAGMVGDKKYGNGLNLDFIMERIGENEYILVLSGRKIGKDNIVNFYLENKTGRFVIDVNTTKLMDKVVNFTYQLPKNIRLKYGSLQNGYRIVAEMPNDVKITNKRVVDNEISVKFMDFSYFINEKQNIKNNKNEGLVVENFDGLQKISNGKTFKRIRISHNKPYIVAIDAGHGGIDPGAISINGKYEKDITLKYAKRFANILRKKGFKVIMTRENDITIPLLKRVQKSQENKADLFISFHTDSHMDKNVSGTTIYRLSNLDNNHPDWKRFYNRQYIPNKYENYLTNKSLFDILLSMTHKSLNEKSSVLADNVLLSFKKTGICVNCRQGQRSLAVLRGLNMISILIEIGYITNKNEEKKILSDSYIEKFSQQLADVVFRTFDV